MKDAPNKTLIVAVFAAVAMNLILLLARTGSADTSAAGTFQAACNRDYCMILNTQTGQVVRGNIWPGMAGQQ